MVNPQMRLLLPVLLILSLTTIGVFAGGYGQSSSQCTTSTCSLTVSRIIWVNDWGTAFMNDTVTLNTTAIVSFIDLGIPGQVADRLAFFSAVDNQSNPVPATQLGIVSANNDHSYLPLRFGVPSMAGSYKFTVRTVFSNLLSFNDTSKTYTLEYPPYPVVDNTISAANSTLVIRTGDWSSVSPSGILGIPSSGTFTADSGVLRPGNVTTGHLSFTSTTQTAFQVSASRTLRISESNAIHITDGYNVTNRGRDVPSVPILLPNGATRITGSDVIGILDDSKVIVAPQDNKTTLVTVTPRFGTVKNLGGLNFKIDYDVAPTQYISSSSLGRYSLNFQVFDNLHFATPSLQARVILPPGFRLDTVEGQAWTSTSSAIMLSASRASALSDLSFSLSYKLDPFWAGLSPLWWAGLLELGLAAAVFVIGAGAPAVSVPGLAPSGLLGRIVDLFDEKAALRLEAAKLDDDVARGALSRQDHRRRKRTIELRTSEIEKKLGPAKQQLGSSQPRYADLMRRLERSEAELQVATASLSDLRNQYRGGRMAREAFESLMNDLQRRKERAQQTIDNIVIGLREEAR